MALLLTPRERETERQKEQARLAKESGELGRKVDELRELEQSSKHRLQEFQEKEFAKFTDTKENWTKELDVLQSKIEQKKSELADYFEKNPIDKKWLLFVRTEKGNIEIRQAEIARLSVQLSLKEKKQAEKDDEQAEKEKSLKQEKLTIASLREKTEEDEKEATQALGYAQEKARRLVESGKMKEKQADETLQKAQIVLREAELKREVQDTREKELEDRELSVIVQELRFYSPVKAPLQAKKPI